MKYRSTRGSYQDNLTFSEVVLIGLAKDGGLFIPHDIPKLPNNWYKDWYNYSFTELAIEIFSLYISETEIPRKDLQKLIEQSYSTTAPSIVFRDKEVTPIKKIKDRLYILELFHGPTFAFKDVALQFLGNLFEYLLIKKNNKSVEKNEEEREKITIVGATSGDTGSAAIYGLRGKKDISVFILHPHGKVSPIQEAQMTSVLDNNVHNLAVKGTFDDCQDTVKALFADVEFNQKHKLGAVNSINWARILAQIVYYYHSYFQLLKSLNISPSTSASVPDIKLQYCVPTGNFGDVLADGEGKEKKINITCSTVNDWMKKVKSNQNIIVDKSILDIALCDFTSSKVTNEETLKAIKTYYSPNSDNQVSYLLDPHTAVGVAAAEVVVGQNNDPNTYQICLSTAHPAKFSETVVTALKNFQNFDFQNILPVEFKGLLEKEKNVVFVEKADKELVKTVIEKELEKEKTLIK
ncbi:8814_t:CDS:2 [Entrophospora sp. SA101]|nr:12710_t:CDS:2 [Entrophospora sp. SA101]CAJ0746030.1 13039_t:CDS:2 [Entrophospora sp. SA101]CAJ0764620.1 8814_t:CDS:2 [Entrophospora sp. SA101]CAJ0824847.1 11866_t:CDS:2 [Entrophospora sp. SA101]CAJ0915046.1 18792_t:CDS:2 [Entrophospora sp. SA101]